MRYCFVKSIRDLNRRMNIDILGISHRAQVELGLVHVVTVSDAVTYEAGPMTPVSANCFPESPVAFTTIDV
jgi:hypothetical protein